MTYCAFAGRQPSARSSPTPSTFDDGTMSFEANAEGVTSPVAKAIAAASFVAPQMWKVPAWAV